MSPGVEGTRALRGAVRAAKSRSREWQAEQIRRTGFATDRAELGHEVISAMRHRGYPLTVATVAGHLAAVGTGWNWQGNARIADLVGRSERTVQRARKRLEDDGLISSHLLLTGDMIDGQRSPVRHPQVVRDVSRLQRLVQVRGAIRAAPHRKKRRRPSVAEIPTPERVEPVTADVHDDLAAAHPEFASYHAILAAAARRGEQRVEKLPPNAAHVTPEEIDEWDRVTAEMERELHQRQRSPPTERGPPSRD